jgi:hypothetical protein
VAPPTRPAQPTAPVTAPQPTHPAPAVVAVETRTPPDTPSANGPPAAHKSDDDDSLFEKPDSVADRNLEVAARPAIVGPVAKPQAASRTPKRTPTPAVPAPTAPPSGGRKLLGIAVDVMVGLILLVIGVVLGELLAKQSTREVLKDAGSATKFPPIALLLWMAPSVLFALVYMLLAGRGKTLGGWLRRRSAA